MHPELTRLLPILCLTACVPFQVWADDADLAKRLSSAGIAGAIVVSSINEGETFVHEELRANQRIPAASTFKTLNTLISLEENVISMDDTLKWDGISRPVPEWNRASRVSEESLSTIIAIQGFVL